MVVHKGSTAVADREIFLGRSRVVQTPVLYTQHETSASSEQETLFLPNN